jgi:peptidoglycan/xylan/chitin deacetylase (PgdA/CDA1 family)
MVSQNGNASEATLRPVRRYFPADSLFSFWFARERSGGLILTFHAICSADQELFQSGLEYLAKECSILPLEELVNRRHWLPKPVLALTFDDGLRNQFTCAYPVLQRLAVPATFFVCPNVIETGRWLWTKEVRTRLWHLSSEERKSLSAKLGFNSTDVATTMEWLKRLPLAKRMQAEETLREATSNFRPSREQCEEFDPMNWTELTSLDPSLITIGSHTLNHPVLTLLEAEELTTEIRESRTRLEEKLCRPVRHFCYPEGRHDQTIRDFVRRHYSAAVSTIQGSISAESDVYCLPRVPAIYGAALLPQRQRNVLSATA